ncbi:MAG: cytochrome B [Gammaproteobacteria bacterium]|nr:cytochrome B [Gammaproteobacteria bacterium]
MSEQPGGKPVLIWDIALRVTHWSLVILVSVSIYTGLTGGLTEMDVHMLSGYGILGLVTFRVIWGVVGPRHARFASFLAGPRAMLAHLRSLPKRSPDTSGGHNPLGALSVVALLLALLAQAGTGLFANDDIMLEGPLVHLISYDLSRELTSVHKTVYWILGGLIGLHLAAIAYYTLYKRTRLIRPMLSGYKRGVPAEAAVRHRLLLAMPLAAGVAAGVYWLVTAV